MQTPSATRLARFTTRLVAVPVWPATASTGATGFVLISDRRPSSRFGATPYPDFYRETITSGDLSSFRDASLKWFRCLGCSQLAAFGITEFGEDGVSFCDGRGKIVACWFFERLFKEANRSTSTCESDYSRSRRNLAAPFVATGPCTVSRLRSNRFQQKVERGWRGCRTGCYSPLRGSSEIHTAALRPVPLICVVTPRRRCRLGFHNVTSYRVGVCHISAEGVRRSVISTRKCPASSCLPGGGGCAGCSVTLMHQLPAQDCWSAG